MIHKALIRTQLDYAAIVWSWIKRRLLGLQHRRLRTSRAFKIRASVLLLDTIES